MKKITTHVSHGDSGELQPLRDSSHLNQSLIEDSFGNSSLKNEYDDDRFLNAREAAGFLGVPYNSLLNMTSSGKVPYYKLGRRNRYRKSELRELLLKNRRGGLIGN